MSEEIQVSIICNAYNHQPYIRQALDGFVMQKTNFPFEVLIHDDASTDKTAEIIREYEAKYPNLIKPIYQTENQYSQKKSPSLLYQYPRAKGRYFASCEGDDYWTDPNKLQKQFDALEAHPDIDLCAHGAELLDMVQGKSIGEVAPAKEEGVLLPQQVIGGLGGYLPTASLFYRREIVDQPMAFQQKLWLDYTLQIRGALRGGVYFFPDCMSVYRLNAAGDSWTAKTLRNTKRRIAFWEKAIEMLGVLDAETQGEHKQAIEKTIKHAQFMILKIQGRYGDLKKEPYAGIYRNMSKKERLLFRFERYAPGLLQGLQRMWHKIK